MDTKMKITKRQLRRIIKEEKARLVNEMRHQRAEEYASADAIEASDDLYSALRRAGFGVEAMGDDVLYIMTGASEGITVKVLKRGR